MKSLATRAAGAAFAAFLVVGALAGCGGAENDTATGTDGGSGNTAEAPAADSDTDANADTNADGATDSETGPATDTASDRGPGSPFCTAVDAAYQDFDDLGDDDMTGQIGALQSLKDAAPADLQQHFQVYIDVLQKINDAGADEDAVNEIESSLDMDQLYQAEDAISAAMDACHPAGTDLSEEFDPNSIDPD
ncbi:MAG: hypothetical protein LBH13_06000 [Cellulomonadaceae bacterium]|jgi:hypothetical protein|nr:hypothetical protein [Cellulomonadaceae bacterium]